MQARNPQLSRILVPFIIACAARQHAANPAITEPLTADPAAILHDDTVYLYTGHDETGEKHPGYGNQRCRYVKLKPDMTEIEGPIHIIDLPKFTEAPWVHKKGKLYYLSYAYAYEFPEKTAYAMAEKITGP